MGTRADTALVQRGLARSRRHATDLIKAGRVLAEGRVVRKPSTDVEPTTELTVSSDASEPDYASRAGSKLAGALDLLADQFPVEYQAVVEAITDPGGCLDIGASTGGFTDVLLRRGAKGVVALDVGHGQLRPELRQDPRVTVIEGANIRDVSRTAWPGQVPAFVVADLSFISLRLVVPVISDLLDPGDLALLLVKPQFEVGKDQLARDGIVRSEEMRRKAVDQVGDAATKVGLTELARLASPVVGANGNQEYFLLLRRD